MGKRSGEVAQAVAYLRTSSAANVGIDKDSDKRQRDAIAAFAKRAGFAIVDEFYDPAVSGADPIETRPGFAALLDRMDREQRRAHRPGRGRQPVRPRSRHPGNRHSGPDRA